MKVARARHAQRTVPQAAFARCRCPKIKRCGIAKAACRHPGDSSPAPGGSNRGWRLADAEPRNCILDKGRSRLRGLTFELSGRRRQDAGPGLAKMYRVPPDRAWWPAVGAPLERVVRPRLHDWVADAIRVAARYAQRTVPQAAFARCRYSKTKRCGIAKAACRHTGDRSPEPRGSKRGWCRADAKPRSCILDKRRSCLRGLTFELSGRQRQDARPGLAKMYRVPPDRAWWPAVGAPLERVVRPRLHGWWQIR